MIPDRRIDQELLDRLLEEILGLEARARRLRRLWQELQLRIQSEDEA